MSKATAGRRVKGVAGCAAPILAIVTTAYTVNVHRFISRDRTNDITPGMQQSPPQGSAFVTAVRNVA